MHFKDKERKDLYKKLLKTLKTQLINSMQPKAAPQGPATAAQKAPGTYIVETQQEAEQKISFEFLKNV